MAYLSSPASPEGSSNVPVKRVRIWYGLLIAVLAIFFVRLFYLQVIRYDHYKTAALSDQLKQYEIPATRGTISAFDGDKTLPIVLNEKLYTLYADPTFIKDAVKVADSVAQIVGGDSSSYQSLIADGKKQQSRYVILGKKLTEEQKNKITALKYPGLGAQSIDYRTYPQGTLAAQTLGFVNDDGKGTYGVEQALNTQLKGKAGELKAITDIKGVPLAASSGNVQKPAEPGKDVVLTLDIAMQKQLESILAKDVQAAKSDSGSALIMDVDTGAIKAMANYPTYDPAKYFDVTDASVFTNNAVAVPIEVGSVMKPLTTAAALDMRAIKPDQTYSDPAKWKVDGFTITNIEEDGPAGVRSIRDILNLSLNTGATWELMQMGGGTINQKARSSWYDYMVNHFQFGKSTGIEQGYEGSGYVPKPADNGAGINLTYANTTFGQAMTATAVQMGAALSATVNGGTYYQPHLLAGTLDSRGNLQPAQPKVVKSGVVSGEVSKDLIPMMQYTIDHHFPNPPFDQTHYMVGGKTGTAQIAKPGGGYYDNEFNGTYTGFVGGDKPQYVIVSFVMKPHNGGYAGTQAAMPVFVDAAHMLINNSFVSAKN
jgi:cell division protein FtsI/penicillin-binding protein 2